MRSSYVPFCRNPVRVVTRYRRLFIFSLLIIGLCSVYFTVSKYQFANYTHTDLKLKCKYSKLEIMGMLKLTYEIREVLLELRIDHWLMYGSILGALREEAPLPWDYDVDMGIRGEQFSIAKKQQFFDLLKARGIGYKDEVQRRGLIKCIRPNMELKVDVFTFYDYGGTMKRPGWESWLLFANYNYYHSYPAYLVKSPLPLRRFGYRKMPVPRNGNEITKHLYRSDWWKVVKPHGC